jgi:hypothetical protein
MSWAHRKLVPASCAGLDFREIEAELLAARSCFRGTAGACLSATLGYREASSKASLYT